MCGLGDSTNGKCENAIQVIHHKDRFYAHNTPFSSLANYRASWYGRRCLLQSTFGYMLALSVPQPNVNARLKETHICKLTCRQNWGDMRCEIKYCVLFFVYVLYVQPYVWPWKCVFFAMHVSGWFIWSSCFIILYFLPIVIYIMRYLFTAIPKWEAFL